MIIYYKVYCSIALYILIWFDFIPFIYCDFIDLEVNLSYKRKTVTYV